MEKKNLCVLSFIIILWNSLNQKVFFVVSDLKRQLGLYKAMAYVLLAVSLVFLIVVIIMCMKKSIKQDGYNNLANDRAAMVHYNT